MHRPFRGSLTLAQARAMSHRQLAAARRAGFLPPLAGADPMADLRALDEQARQANEDAGRAWNRIQKVKQAIADTPVGSTSQATLDALNAASAEFETHSAVLDDLAARRTRAIEGLIEGGNTRPAEKAAGSRGRAGRERPGVPEGTAGTWLANEINALALNTSGGIGNAITPIDQPDVFFDLLTPMSVGLASGFTLLPTDKSEVSIPRITQDPTAAWTAENTAITESEPVGDSVVAHPQKVAALTVISSEVWNDANPFALGVSERSLLRSVSLGLDLGFVEGSGTAPQIRGLKNVAGIQTVDMDVNGAQVTDLDPIISAIGLLAAANAQATAIVMHPRTWTSLMRLRESTDSLKPLISAGAPSGVAGAPLQTIQGIPVFLTSQISTTETQGTSTDTSSIYVYEAPSIVAVRRQDAQLAVDPFYGFDTDQVGVRAICRYDIVVPEPKAVVRVRGVRP